MNSGSSKPQKQGGKRLGGDVRLKLIRLVKENEVLYDPKHAKHSDKGYVELLWSKIAAQIGLPDGKEANKKWRYLKDSWRVQKKKKLAFPDGSVPIKWPYYDEMSFMDKFMSCGSLIHYSNPFSMYSSLTDHYPMDKLYHQNMIDQGAINDDASPSTPDSENGLTFEKSPYESMGSPNSAYSAENQKPISNNNEGEEQKYCEAMSPNLSSDEAINLADDFKHSKRLSEHVAIQTEHSENLSDRTSRDVEKYCEYLSSRMQRLSRPKIRSLMFLIDSFLFENEVDEEQR